jgi:hypothetical protein
MPSSQDIANDAVGTFAAYPELATKIDDGTTVPDSQLDRWIGASYANFVDGCLEQINEVFVGSRAISGPLRVKNAPASGWNSGADDLLIGDGVSGRGVSIFSSDAGSSSIAFRTTRSAAEGLVSYNASIRCLNLQAALDVGTDAALELCGDATSGSLAPTLVGASTDLGKSNGKWRDAWLKRHAYIGAATAPATPSSGAVLYVDSADGALKVKFSTGTVVTLGTP